MNFKDGQHQNIHRANVENKLFLSKNFYNNKLIFAKMLVMLKMLNVKNNYNLH